MVFRGLFFGVCRVVALIVVRRVVFIVVIVLCYSFLSNFALARSVGKSCHHASFGGVVVRGAGGVHVALCLSIVEVVVGRRSFASSRGRWSPTSGAVIFVNVSGRVLLSHLVSGRGKLCSIFGLVNVLV